VSRTRRVAGLVAIVSVLVAITLGLANSRRVAWDPVDGDLWTETVKKGTMPWDVRGTGTLVRTRNPGKLIARVTVPDATASELQLNQNADVDTRKVTVKGHVSSIGPSPSNGLRSVDITLRSPLPDGVGEDLRVDATIHLGTLENILYVGRPVHAKQNSSISIFKIVDDGGQAVRVNVKFGRASVNTIEVLDGLKEGDKIIPSDMSAWENFERIPLR
jgi:hypothetical protein